MRTIGYAIVGTGTISEFHYRSIAALEGARFIGVHSRNESRGKECAEQWNGDAFASYSALLADPRVDVVAIATPSGSHAALAEAALRAGKHVVVEKPIAMRAADAERLHRLAVAAGKICSVVSQRRFEPVMQWVYGLVRNGSFGVLYYLEGICPFYRPQSYYDASPWRGTLAEDGGAVMNQGIHMLDLMLWIGGSVREVSGAIDTFSHRMEAEDFGMAQLRYESGTLGYFMAATATYPGFPPTLRVFGERGSVFVVGSDIAHCSVPAANPPTSAPSGSSTGAGEADPKQIPYEPHQRQYADIHESIATGRRPSIASEEGVRAVAVAEAIYRSHREKRPVAVEEMIE